MHVHYVRPCTIEPYTGGPCENFGLYEMLRNSLLHRFFFFSFLLVSAIQNQNATTETQTSHQTIGNHFVSGQCGVVNNIIILLHSPIVVCSVFALRRRNRVKKKKAFFSTSRPGKLCLNLLLPPPLTIDSFIRFVLYLSMKNVSTQYSRRRRLQGCLDIFKPLMII